MTSIVTTHYRHKRPPRKRKAVAIEVPAVVTTKSRRPTWEDQAAAEVSVTARHDDGGAAQPSTPRAIARVDPPPANDDRPEATSPHDGTRSAIVTTTSKKQLQLLRAAKRAPTTDGDPEMRAWLLRAMQGRWRHDD